MELSTTYLLIILLVSVFIFVMSLYVSYKLVKYGIKNDILWPTVVAFFISGLWTILFYVFLRDKKNRKEREEREERKIRSERMQTQWEKTK